MKRLKFVIGGLAVLGAVVFLIITSTTAGAQYFYTVNELYDEGSEAIGKPVRVSGAVLGDTINYDPESLTLTFTVAHMPADNDLLEEEGGLAEALHAAVTDPSRKQLDVVYIGPKPDLLQNEAQAIMTGTVDKNGVFQADELLLKCPTRYEEAVPEQANE